MWWIIGGVFGALGVALGAFGAHGLEDILAVGKAESWWQTAARYHLVHALALFAVAAHPRRPILPGISFVVGIILFSGSLYVMALTQITKLGMITPLGGASFILGWLALAFWPRSTP